jgi:hypothetical protein
MSPSTTTFNAVAPRALPRTTKSPDTSSGSPSSKVTVDAGPATVRRSSLLASHTAPARAASGRCTRPSPSTTSSGASPSIANAPRRTVPGARPVSTGSSSAACVAVLKATSAACPSWCIR